VQWRFESIVCEVAEYDSHSSAQRCKQWLAVLDIIETLKPRAVIAERKKAERDDSPRIIEETRQQWLTVVEIFRKKGNT
jgi:hypothetical protein